MLLGDKLKAIRLRSGMTLAELSARAGVSKSMLSRVERNDAAPTVTTLRKIAGALDVDAAHLLDPADDALSRDAAAALTAGADGSPRAARARGRDGSPAVSVVRAGRRKTVTLPWGANYDMLTPDLQRPIEFILITYPVSGRSGDLYAHEGEECGFVLEGHFKGVVGDEEFILGPGDSICYASTIPHRWENDGDVDAKAVWAITPPSFLNGVISD